MPGFDVQVWFGILMPAGAPKTAITAVNERITKMIGQPDVRKRLIDQGADAGESEALRHGWVSVQSSLVLATRGKEPAVAGAFWKSPLRCVHLRIGL